MKQIYSIRWRLVASYVILTLLAVALMGILSLTLVKQYIDQQETEFLTANAEAVAHQVAPFIRLGFPPKIALQEVANTAAFLGNVQVKILDRTQQILADSGPQTEADNFIWIRPRVVNPWSMTDFIAGDTPFSHLEDETTLAFDFPSIVFMDGMVDIQALPDSILFEQFPSGIEVVKGRRVGGMGGYRIIFDDDSLPHHLSETRPISSEGISKLIEVQTRRQNQDSPPPSIDDVTGLQTDKTLPQANPERSAKIITVPIGDVADPVGYVELRNGPNFGSEAVVTMRQALIWTATGVVLLAVLVGLLVSRSLLSPLHSLMFATGEMSSGNLTVRATVKRADEFGALAYRFNQMVQRLEASFSELAAERDALRQFIADASHEFRTPITALKSFNELLQTTAANDQAAQAEFLAESEVQLNRLEWISHNLLDLSRFDAGLIELELSEQVAQNLVTTVVDTFKKRAADKQILLDMKVPTDSYLLNCDQVRLELALCNLLDNAVKFTPNGGSIEVGFQQIAPNKSEAEAIKKTLRFWIADTGPGIESEEQNFIFDRFYRGRTHTKDGSGLGLAIVKHIVELHQGCVFTEKDRQVGSCFIIDIPVYSSVNIPPSNS